MNNRPIGIFDSGVGGLTVAKAVSNLMNNEDIIYFGDTAHMPYGDRSPQNVRELALRITDFLVEQDCKAVVIACNTASAHAYEAIKEHLWHKAPQVIVQDVIWPNIEQIREKGLRKIGLIATRGTIRSGIYPKIVAEHLPQVIIRDMATPLLAPMVEEGFIYDEVSSAVVSAYLSKPRLADIDALVLACTHYSVIKNQILKHYDFRLPVIDSVVFTARSLKRRLEEKDWLATLPEGRHQFFVSEASESFRRIAEMFFDDDLEVRVNNLWG